MAQSSGSHVAKVKSLVSHAERHGGIHHTPTQGFNDVPGNGPAPRKSGPDPRAGAAERSVTDPRDGAC